MTRRQRLAVACGLLTLVALMGPAFAEDGPPLLATPERALPLLIVAPQFPSKVEAPAGGAQVEVTGTVLPDGRFQDPKVTGVTGAAAFVGAVAEVVAQWRFTPAVDDDSCMPKARQVVVTISFEGTSQEPHVFVSMPNRDDASARQPPPYESISSPHIAYPSKMLRNDIEGQVLVLTRFAPNGDAQSVNILSSTPPGAFEAVVLQAARRTTVTWKKESPVAPVCALRRYTFCIEGATNSPLRFLGCRH